MVTIKNCLEQWFNFVSQFIEYVNKQIPVILSDQFFDYYLQNQNKQIDPFSIDTPHWDNLLEFLKFNYYKLLYNWQSMPHMLLFLRFRKDFRYDNLQNWNYQ